MPLRSAETGVPALGQSLGQDRLCQSAAEGLYPKPTGQVHLPQLCRGDVVSAKPPKEPGVQLLLQMLHLQWRLPQHQHPGQRKGSHHSMHTQVSLGPAVRPLKASPRSLHTQGFSSQKGCFWSDRPGLLLLCKIILWYAHQSPQT